MILMTPEPCITHHYLHAIWSTFLIHSTPFLSQCNRITRTQVYLLYVTRKSHNKIRNMIYPSIKKWVKSLPVISALLILILKFMNYKRLVYSFFLLHIECKRKKWISVIPFALILAMTIFIDIYLDCKQHQFQKKPLESIIWNYECVDVLLQRVKCWLWHELFWGAHARTTILQRCTYKANSEHANMMKWQYLTLWKTFQINKIPSFH